MSKCSHTKHNFEKTEIVQTEENFETLSFNILKEIKYCIHERIPECYK